MSSHIPERAVPFGFMVGGLGAHTSRTMMLAELRLLLAARPASAGLEEYRSAVLDDNVLLKETAAVHNRQPAAKHKLALIRQAGKAPPTPSLRH